jgi:hypothetical protein
LFLKSNRGDVLARQACDATLPWRLLLVLWFAALASRLPGVWLLPSADGDAYSYAETIGAMSEKMIQGTFSFSDLFGFWLPLYQFTSAVVASLLHLSPLLAGKLVSACCAAGSAVIVFSLTLRITRNHTVAWIAFAFLVLDPLHVFLSGLSLTDVPNAFLVVASMHSAACGHWRRAAAWAAFAELVRIDSWILLLVLPAIQFIWERRVSRTAIVLLLLAPALWLVVCFVARGDAFAYFAERTQYVESYLQFHPGRRGFGLFAMEDVGNLIVGAHMMVLPLALVASGLLLACGRRRIFTGLRSSVTSLAPVVVASYFCASLGFLTLAYLSRSQPVIWVRYGLILFVIGLPLAAWMLYKAWLARHASPTRRRFAWASLVAICAAQVVLELNWIVATARDDGAHRRIAIELRRIAKAEGWAGAPGLSETTWARCFCDDPAVRVLSGLPSNRFLRTAGNENISSLVDFLYRHKAKYLVFAHAEHSLPASSYPELGTAVQVQPPFTLVRWEPSPNHFGPDLWLYRVELPDAVKF